MANYWKRFFDGPAFAPTLALVSALISGTVSGLVVANYNNSAQLEAELVKARRDSILSAPLISAKGSSDGVAMEMAFGRFFNNAKYAAILPKSALEKYVQLGATCRVNDFSDECIERMAKAINITRQSLSLEPVELADLKRFLELDGSIETVRLTVEKALHEGADGITAAPPPPPSPPTPVARGQKSRSR